MERARDRLEREGFQIMFGILALAPEHHARSKGAECLSDKARGQLCNLFCKEIDWLSFDPRGPSHRSGGQMIRLFAKEHPDLVGFNVVGADVAARYGPRGHSVVIAREGTKLVPEDRTKYQFCAEELDSNTASFSSTTVRAAVLAKNASEVQRMCGAVVAATLLDESR